MYEGDSFFTLSAWGQVGLLALSAVFAVLALWLARTISRRRALWARVVIGFVLYQGFVWLSPQGYYLYYWTIIPDLPMQWVIASRPPVEDALAYLTFSGRATLSAHSQGALGWAMMVTSLWPRRPVRRDAAN